MARRFRDLPLAGKLLVPSFGLIVVVAGLGAFVVARDVPGGARGERAAELALIVLAGIAALAATVALLRRAVLGRLRTLTATNSALAEGILTARAPVLGKDELGQLAAGLNNMADQLQATVEQLESRVARGTAEVRRLLQERTDFFTALSHECRTPLAVILGQADMIADPSFAKRPGFAKEAGATIRSAGAQLLDIMDAILDLARAEARGLDVTLEPVRIADVVRDTRPALDELARVAHVKLVVRVPRGLPAVRADRARVRDVLTNLVGNATKYTPAGGTVTVRARALDDACEISVADTGVGIPADAGDRIFEPFYRVKGTSTQAGQPSTGLGLALTKRLVEAQGGSIRFESVPGDGTIFFVSLPTESARAATPRLGDDDLLSANADR